MSDSSCSFNLEYSVPELGTLRMRTVFHIYDGLPLVYVSERADGTLFFAIQAGETDAGDEFYHYARVSPERLVEIEQCRFTLRDVYLHPEDGEVFRVTLLANRGGSRTERLRPDQLEQDSLSVEGAMLYASPEKA